MYTTATSQVPADVKEAYARLVGHWYRKVKTDAAANFQNVQQQKYGDTFVIFGANEARRAAGGCGGVACPVSCAADMTEQPLPQQPTGSLRLVAPTRGNGNPERSGADHVRRLPPVRGRFGDAHERPVPTGRGLRSRAARRPGGPVWTHYLVLDPSADVRDGCTRTAGSAAVVYADGDEVRVPGGAATPRFVVVWVETVDPGTPREFKRAYLMRHVA